MLHSSNTALMFVLCNIVARACSQEGQGTQLITGRFRGFKSRHAHSTAVVPDMCYDTYSQRFAKNRQSAKAYRVVRVPRVHQPEVRVRVPAAALPFCHHAHGGTQRMGGWLVKTFSRGVGGFIAGMWW